VYVICSGHFTKDAIKFAQGLPIELINGEQLVELIAEVKDDYALLSYRHTGEFYIPDKAKSLCGLHWQAKVNPAVCSSAVIPGIVSEISLV